MVGCVAQCINCVHVWQGIYPCNKLVPNPTVVHAALSLVTARFWWCMNTAGAEASLFVGAK